MTLNETTIWKKNLGISTKNPSKTRLFFLMYIKFTFTFKFHSVPLLNLTVILCRRPSSDTLESINTHRIYCKPDNISASWNQFCWCLVPDLFWLFFPPFTENVSDTILLHNEDLNCRQSESSKAEQTALIIFFKYCYVGMKAFGSHNAFFFFIFIRNMNRFRGTEAQWGQFSTSFIQTQIHYQSKHCFLHSPTERSNRNCLL